MVNPFLTSLLKARGCRSIILPINLAGLILMCAATSGSGEERPSTLIREGDAVKLSKLWPAIKAAPRKQMRTIEFWVRPDARSIAKPRSFLFILSNAAGNDTAGLSLGLARGRLQVNAFATQLTGPVLKANAWSHVALTVNTNTINKEAVLWINGKRVDESLVLEPFAKSFVVAEMFCDHWSQKREFEGRCGDIRISSAIRYKKDFVPQVRLTKDKMTSFYIAGDAVPLER